MCSVLKVDITGGKTEEGRKNRMNSESLGSSWVCSVSKVDTTGAKTEEGRKNRVNSASLGTFWVRSVLNVEEIQKKEGGIV